MERGFGEICTDFDRSILEWVQNGELSRVADIPDDDILNNGDVELRQGISFFGALPEGLRPATAGVRAVLSGAHGLLGRILGDRRMTIDLQDFRRELDDGVLDPSIFLDEEIYQLELERIWRRSWVFLGHETMLAGPGDFITTLSRRGPDPAGERPSGQAARLPQPVPAQGREALPVGPRQRQELQLRLSQLDLRQRWQPGRRTGGGRGLPPLGQVPVGTRRGAQGRVVRRFHLRELGRRRDVAR